MQNLQKKFYGNICTFYSISPQYSIRVPVHFTEHNIHQCTCVMYNLHAMKPPPPPDEYRGVQVWQFSFCVHNISELTEKQLDCQTMPLISRGN